MIIKAQKKLEVPKSPQLNCLAWNKKNGYLAYVNCQNTVKAMKLKHTWESRFPPPEYFCGGGDKDKDPRCAVPVPGFGHPHVVMIDDHFYTLQIDLA